MEDSVEIDISVVDVNDNRPEFLGFDASRPVVISVASDAQQGEVIKRLQVKKVLIKMKYLEYSHHKTAKDVCTVYAESMRNILCGCTIKYIFRNIEVTPSTVFSQYVISIHSNFS